MLWCRSRNGLWKSLSKAEFDERIPGYTVNCIRKLVRQIERQWSSELMSSRHENQPRIIWSCNGKVHLTQVCPKLLTLSELDLKIVRRRPYTVSVQYTCWVSSVSAESWEASEDSVKRWNYKDWIVLGLCAAIIVIYSCHAVCVSSPFSSRGKQIVAAYGCKVAIVNHRLSCQWIITCDSDWGNRLWERFSVRGLSHEKPVESLVTRAPVGDQKSACRSLESPSRSSYVKLSFVA